MKNLLFILLIISTSCSTLKKVKKANQEQTRTETATQTEHAIRERVDTVLIEPARYDSVLASLRDLFAGVNVGPSKVRFDTITNTVYLNTPIKYIPYYIDRYITTTIKEKAKTEKEVKSKSVDIEKDQQSLIGFAVSAFLIILLLLFFFKK